MAGAVAEPGIKNKTSLFYTSNTHFATTGKFVLYYFTLFILTSPWICLKKRDRANMSLLITFDLISLIDKLNYK